MGKYDKIIGTLEPLPVEDPKAQEKIEKIKAEIRASDVHTPTSLAQEYEKTRFGTIGPNGVAGLDEDTKNSFFELLGKEGLADLQSEIQKRLTAIEQLLTDSFMQDEIGWGQFGASSNMVKLVGGESLAVQLEPIGKVEDKEVFRLWCVANGLENSLQLWPSTMVAITKERLLAGEAAPDGVKAYSRPKIVWRKG